MLKTQEIFDLHFLNTNMDKLVHYIEYKKNKTGKTFIVTANPEILMYAEENENYKKIIKNADFILPDGIGVVLGSKILGRSLQQRLTGFDLMERLLKLSNQKGYKVFFLGAEPHVIDKAVENIQSKHINLNIVGFHHGYFNDNEERIIIDEINRKQPDFIFVGLGYPRQEKWIYQHIDQLKKGTLMGVGGSFDVWAGKVNRAPISWQNLNIEWLYRLIKQPTRWKRMVVLPLFILKVINIRAKELIYNNKRG